MTDQPNDQPQEAVVDDDQPTDRPPGHVDQPATDQPTTPALVSLEDAADTLGITVNAVRQRIKRGTLIGIKTDAGWLVDMVATNQESGTDRPTTRPTNQAAPATDHRPTIALTPMVNHIAVLEEQVQRLTESNTMWQIRARQAEEQLLQLTAGESEPASSQDSPTIDAQTFRPLQASDEAPTGIWAWVKRLWRP